jgi:tetratricopeptide (TPR) repeat protein
MAAVSPIPVSPSDTADRALDLVEANPAEARALALVALAGRADPAAASRSERVLGMVAMRLDDYGSALRHLRRAVRLAERAGADVRAAEARMTLALVLAHRGSTESALEEIDRAGAVLRGVEAARALMQRALILQRLGRLDESLDGYRRALPALRRAGDKLVESRALCNRGLVHAYRGELVAAAADLVRSERLCIELGQDVGVAVARQNLGFVAAQQGDIPRALRYYDEAAELYQAVDALPAVLYRDRCEALLSVCLADEARQAAEQAVALLAHGRMRVDLAEARLMLAEAALAEGDVEAAADAAAQALRQFRHQRRASWAALARYVLLKANRARREPSRRLLGTALRTADALAAAGWTIAAVDARLIGARVALELGERAGAEELLAATRRARSRGPAELRARAWHAEALSRLIAGDAPGTERALRAGLRVVDDHRALIGARELRTHVSGHAVELAALGLRTALESGNALRVLAWAERSRAGSLLLRPARPPDDSQLAGDLARLRRIAGEHEQATLAGADAARLGRLERELEEAIRDRSRRTAGTGIRASAGLPPVRELRDALGAGALVEFVQLDRELHVATLVAGRAELRRLGPSSTVERDLEALRFALRRLAHGRGSEGSRAAALASALDCAERLDRLLLAPLLPSLGDRELVVVPTGLLHALPWSLLPSCRGRPLVAAPSARLWYETAVRAGDGGGSRVLVAGPGLPHAAAEVEALAASYERASVLTGARAGADRVKALLDGAALAHIAAHGRFRADNPLFSSLLLADGPLTVHDLETLTTTPRLVILSACDSGLSAVHPGDELMGLAAAFLTLGTHSLIASVMPVPDGETRQLMLAVHRGLRAGSPPRVALAEAQERVAATGERGLAAAAGFLCLGAA